MTTSQAVRREVRSEANATFVSMICVICGREFEMGEQVLVLYEDGEDVGPVCGECLEPKYGLARR